MSIIIGSIIGFVVCCFVIIAALGAAPKAGGDNGPAPTWRRPEPPEYET